MVLEYAFGRRGILREKLRWPDGSPHQIASAIRAGTVEFIGGAVAAEGAFECAYHCRSRIRRQISIAIFTVRTNFKHSEGSSSNRVVFKMLIDVILKISRETFPYATTPHCASNGHENFFTRMTFHQGLIFLFFD